MAALEFDDCTDEGEKVYVGFYLHPKHLEIFIGGDCHTESFVLSKEQITQLINFLQKHDSRRKKDPMGSSQSDSEQ